MLLLRRIGTVYLFIGLFSSVSGNGIIRSLKALPPGNISILSDGPTHLDPNLRLLPTKCVLILYSTRCPILYGGVFIIFLSYCCLRKLSYIFCLSFASFLIIDCLFDKYLIYSSGSEGSN